MPPKAKPTKKKKKARAKRAGPAAAKADTKAPVVKLSKCAILYAKAALDPWTGPLACVPDLTSMRTTRARERVNGTATLTADGNLAYFAFFPTNPAISYGSASELTQPVLQISQTGLTPPTTWPVANDATPANWTSTSFNSPYSSSVNSKLIGRVVGYGFRVRWVGTELNMGGRVMMFVDPDHSQINAEVISSYNAAEYVRWCPLNRDWCGVVWTPSSDVERQFAPYATSFASGSFSAFAGGCVVYGAAAGQVEYELCMVVEYVWKAMRGGQHGETDLVGLSAVASHLPAGGVAMPAEKPQKNADDFLHRVVGSAAKVTSSIVGVVKDPTSIVSAVGDTVDAIRSLF